MKGGVFYMKQILFRGAATALVTPMQPDGSLDLETLSRLTEWQIQSSISALVPCGTTGEAATLTDEERFTVIQTVAKTAAGRVPVIAGAMTPPVPNRTAWPPRRPVPMPCF